MPRTKFKTIDAYIKACPKQTQPILRKLRQAIHGTIPKAEEVISYNIPCFKLNGSYLIYFAGYEKHVSLYPIPKTTATLAKEIAPHVAGKGTLRFYIAKPIPYALIKKVVRARVKQTGSK